MADQGVEEPIDLVNRTDHEDLPILEIGLLWINLDAEDRYPDQNIKPASFQDISAATAPGSEQAGEGEDFLKRKDSEESEIHLLQPRFQGRSDSSYLFRNCLIDDDPAMEIFPRSKYDLAIEMSSRVFPMPPFATRITSALSNPATVALE